MVDFGSLKFMSQAPTQASIDEKLYLRVLSPFLGLNVISAAMTCFLGKLSISPELQELQQTQQSLLC